MGPKLRDFELRGEGTRWTHKTMDSDTASGLIPPALRRLADAGIRIANELEYALYMSLGLSFPEAAQLQDDLLRLQQSSGDEPDRLAALARVKRWCWSASRSPWPATSSGCATPAERTGGYAR